MTPCTAQTAVKDKRMADDLSIIIIDMLPDASQSFPESIGGTVNGVPQSGGGGGGGGGCCFSGGKPPAPTGTAAAKRSRYVVDYLADVDCLLVRRRARVLVGRRCQGWCAFRQAGRQSHSRWVVKSFSTAQPARPALDPHSPTPLLQAFPEALDRLRDRDAAAREQAMMPKAALDYTVHGARQVGAGGVVQPALFSRRCAGSRAASAVQIHLYVYLCRRWCSRRPSQHCSSLSSLPVRRSASAPAAAIIAVLTHLTHLPSLPPPTSSPGAPLQPRGHLAHWQLAPRQLGRRLAAVARTQRQLNHQRAAGHDRRTHGKRAAVGAARAGLYQVRRRAWGMCGVSWWCGRVAWRGWVAG